MAGIFYGAHMDKTWEQLVSKSPQELMALITFIDEIHKIKESSC